LTRTGNFDDDDDDDVDTAVLFGSTLLSLWSAYREHFDCRHRGECDQGGA